MPRSRLRCAYGGHGEQLQSTSSVVFVRGHHVYKNVWTPSINEGGGTFTIPILSMWKNRGGGGGGRIIDGGHSDGTLRYMNVYMSSASSNNYKWHMHVYMQVCYHRHSEYVYMQVCYECYHRHSELVL